MSAATYCVMGPLIVLAVVAWFDETWRDAADDAVAYAELAMAQRLPGEARHYSEKCAKASLRIPAPLRDRYIHSAGLRRVQAR